MDVGLSSISTRSVTNKKQLHILKKTKITTTESAIARYEKTIPFSYFRACHKNCKINVAFIIFISWSTSYNRLEFVIWTYVSDYVAPSSQYNYPFRVVISFKKNLLLTSQNILSHECVLIIDCHGSFLVKWRSVFLS